MPAIARSDGDVVTELVNQHWPLIGLRVETPRVTLRYPNDADLLELAELARRGVNVEGEPQWFSFDWAGLPPDERARSVLQFHWRIRGDWTLDDWNCEFVVVVDGSVVGSQGIQAKQFGGVGSVVSGSWLGPDVRNRGIGKEMRAAILHFAFAGLGARRSESAAYDDNERSIGVSRHLGYRDNGVHRTTRGDGAGWQLQFVLERDDWEQKRRNDIEIVGLEACRELFGGNNSGHG